VYLRSGANALDVKEALVERLDELGRTFPPGVEARVVYDTTPFVEASIEEVLHTLVEAMVLVFIVVFVFLQSWRATLIPALAVPVSIIGTFFGMQLFGFSINSITLFGLVLAIGIVVDDAIVVVENVERIMAERHVSPAEASDQAMAEVSGALIAIFPRSEYQMTERGTSIMVPAGTVYAIGADSAAKVMASQQSSSAPQPPPTGLRESTRVDTRVEMRAESSPMRVDTSVDWGTQSTHTTHLLLPASQEASVLWPTGEEGAPVTQSLWTDEQYRAARIAALLDQAGD